MATVLIVEDDAATRLLYQRVLSPCFHILTCATIAEADDILRSHQVNAIVFDPNWPDPAGWNLATALGQNTDTAPIPFVLYSALDERKRGQAAGAAAYLVKPVLPEALKRELMCILNPQS